MFEFKNRVEKYKNSIELNKSTIGGHTPKTFVRVDDNISSYNRHCEESEKNMTYPRPKTVKDSRYFAELFEALLSGNCSYVTIYNDLVSPIDQSESILPKYMSCLVKQYADRYVAEQRDDTSYLISVLTPIYREVVGSRLANALGIKTVYNKAISQYEATIYGDYPRYDTILSVDCVKDNTEDITLRQFHSKKMCRGVDMTQVLKEAYAYDTICEDIAILAEQYKIPNSYECCRTVLKDLIKQALFKWLLCGDWDSANYGNYGVYVTPKKTIEVKPAYDYEFLFKVYEDSFISQRQVCSGAYQARIELVISNIGRKMPDVLDEFMKSVIELRDSGELDRIMKNSIVVPPIVYQDILPEFHVVIDYMQETWNKFSYTQQLINDVVLFNK